MKELWYEKIIEEIGKIIKDNLILIYNYKENSLREIRKCCRENEGKKYKAISSEQIMKYTMEAIKEIENQKFLYDFREIE